MDSDSLSDLARRHGVRLIVQFGSTVTGQQHPGSDLDMAVVLERAPATFYEEAEMIGDLQALYPDQELDVAIINRADPLFLKQITQRCELVYGRSRDLYELKMLAFKRYQDHRRYLALEREYVERTVRALVS